MSQKHLVLLGAGHTHVLALDSIAKQIKAANQKITLICGERVTPYSGMLPGMIAGLYKRNDIVIDVAGITHRAGVAYIPEHAKSIDLARKKIVLVSGKQVGYDLLSINIGGHCVDSIAENTDNVKSIKPVLPFLDWLANWQDKHKLTCAIVGGGVAGVELALCVDHYLRSHKRSGGVFLIGHNSELIPKFPRLSKEISKFLIRRGISPLLGKSATAVESNFIKLENNERFYADKVILCTGVKAWSELKQSGLAVDEKGFVQIKDNFQSISHPEIFACGDCGTIVSSKLAKSGVYAVRQAPILAHNLLAALAGEKMQSWQAQQETLAIICTGDRYAIAHRNSMVIKGRLMWWLKNYLDQSFMRKFKIESS